jgi:HK97 family phage major capsid protein
VCADWRGPLSDDDYGDDMERPVGMRPVGMRPVGMRPVGTRPVGMRPVGMRPVGMRPVGMRPVGMRPVGMRPVGMRPVGMRPVGMRPVGMRDDGTGDDADAGVGYLDPDEWSADVAELFCGYSAVLRLGGRLAYEVTDLPISAWPIRNAEYVPEPPSVDENLAARTVEQDQATARATATTAMNDSETRLYYRRLSPRSHELTARIVMPNRLVRSIVEHPELAFGLKQDLAYALACRADAGFLHGNPAAKLPRGITHIGRALQQAGLRDDPLKAARAMISQLRTHRRVRFDSAGWVLHPKALDALTKVITKNAQNARQRADSDGTSLDSLGSSELLVHDGTDGGVLLGYPFVVTEAAEDDPAAATRRSRMYFSSDWGAAWVAATRPLVEVDFSGDIRFEHDETVVRAIMHHDFALSRPEFFIYTQPPLTDRP